MEYRSRIYRLSTPLRADSRRRSVLTAGLCGLSTATLAGCAGTNAGGGETPEPTATESDEGLPDGVYVQQFRETISMQGTASAGELKIAVMYTSPHRFWRVVGDELQAESAVVTTPSPTATERSTPTPTPSGGDGDAAGAVAAGLALGAALLAARRRC